MECQSAANSGRIPTACLNEHDDEMEAGTGIALVMKAADFAAKRHRAQRRKDPSQTPYINHPLGVGHVLTSEANITSPFIIAAAILHDTVEDTETTIEELKNVFGSTIANIVSQCTEDKRKPRELRKEELVKSAAMLDETARVVILADKLHNLRDLEQSLPVGWDEDRKLDYFRWVMKVRKAMRGTNEGMESALDDIICRNIP